MKVLANDGLTLSGINALEGKGFTVITEKVPQEELVSYINAEKIRPKTFMSPAKSKVNSPSIT